jgi:hypothetical protein
MFCAGACKVIGVVHVVGVLDGTARSLSNKSRSCAGGSSSSSCRSDMRVLFGAAMPVLLERGTPSIYII